MRLTLLLVLLALTPVAATAQQGLSAEEAVSGILTLSDLHWAPDGRRLAFVVTRHDLALNRRRSDLWLADPEARTPARQLTTDPEEERAPRFSPDGRFLSFLARRDGDEAPQLYLLPLAGGEARRLTAAPGGVETYDWAPDGETVAFTAPESEPDPIRRAAGEWRARGFDVVRVDSVTRPAHLWTVRVDDGRLRRLTGGHFYVSGPAFSPDGLWIAHERAPGARPDERRATDLWLIPTTGGDARRLTTNAGPDHDPRWSSDGRRLAFRSAPRDRIEQIHVLPLDGRAPLELTGASDLAVGRAIWSRDGERLFFTAARGVDGPVYSMDAATRRRGDAASGGSTFAASPRRSDGEGSGAVAASGTAGGVVAVLDGPFVVEEIALSPDGRRLAFIRSDPLHPREIFVAPVDAPADSVRQVTRLHAALARRRFADAERIAWTSADGLEIEGLLIRPVGYRRGRVPTVLHLHGGPYGRASRAFNPQWQLLAAAGYAVVAPNFRGSEGYGQAFADAIRGDYGGKEHQDYLAAVDRAIALGVADSTRLAVMGWSYGGYATNWTVTQTHRFRAAIAGAGMSNLVSHYGTSDVQRFREHNFGGGPWETELFWERSPLRYAGNIRTPLLLVHGEADARVPVSQAEELYTALTRRGFRDVVFVRYPREPHGFREPAHRLDLFQRYLAWLDRWLASKPVAAASGHQP